MKNWSKYTIHEFSYVSIQICKNKSMKNYTAIFHSYMPNTIDYKTLKNTRED
jgi:hypothetical protein